MKHIILIIAIGILLSSCSEYSSKYPVGSETEASRYEQLIGDWSYLSHSEDTLDKTSSTYDPHVLRVIPFNDKEFIIEMIPETDTLANVKKHLDDLHLIRGWLTTIDKNQYVNLTPISNEVKEVEYYVHHIKILDDTLVSMTLSDRIFRELEVDINSISDHKNLIKRAIEKSEYWNQKYKYIKKKSH